MKSNRCCWGLPQGTGEGQVAGKGLCYLHFDYAKQLNSCIRKPLCYIEKLEHSLDIQP